MEVRLVLFFILVSTYNLSGLESGDFDLEALGPSFHDKGSGWIGSSWFGSMKPVVGDVWYHQHLEFVHITGDYPDTDGIYVWIPLAGWCWTDPGSYPALFSLEKQRWLYAGHSVSDEPVFYDYRTTLWIANPAEIQVDRAPDYLLKLNLTLHANAATYPEDIFDDSLDINEAQLASGLFTYRKLSPSTARLEYENYYGYTGAYTLTFTSAAGGTYREDFSGEYTGFISGDFTVSEMLVTSRKIPADIQHAMIPVEGGSFYMRNFGGPAIERHTTVDSFQIGKHEVTWSQWIQVHEWANPRSYSISNLAVEMGLVCGDQFPARYIDWYDAIKWCNARSEMEGLTPVYYTDAGFTQVYRSGSVNLTLDNVRWDANGYRLPTEAEWVYAAKGGLLSRGLTYSGSNHIERVAWSFSNSFGTACSVDWGWGPLPVGQKQANELGIHDMNGNIKEWCWDWNSPLDEIATSNPRGPDSGDQRIIRGGDWDSSGNSVFMLDARNASRDPARGDSTTGLRVARHM